MAITSTKLKITAVNIRSVLNKNTKTLEKLNSKKTSLSRKLRLKAERDAAETNIEKKPKKGPLKSILSNISTTVMSIKDKILNFFGYLLMGMLVKNLPIVIEKLKSAYEFVKPLIETAWKVISFIGKSLFKFGGWISGLFNRKKAEENTDLLYDNSTVLEEEIDTINIDNSEDNIQESTTELKPKPLSTDEIRAANPEVVSGTRINEIGALGGGKPSSGDLSMFKDKSKPQTETTPKININSQIGDIVNDNKINKIIHKTNMSSSIFNDDNSKKVISKIKNKNSKNLVGNLDDKTNTVIIPIEVEKIIPTNKSNGGSNTINSVEPLASVGSDMRMP